MTHHRMYVVIANVVRDYEIAGVFHQHRARRAVHLSSDRVSPHQPGYY